MRPPQKVCVFLSDDLDQNQRSRFTQIMVPWIINPSPKWIHQFLWCTMILDRWSWSRSSQRNARKISQCACRTCSTCKTWKAYKCTWRSKSVSNSVGKEVFTLWDTAVSVNNTSTSSCRKTNERVTRQPFKIDVHIHRLSEFHRVLFVYFLVYHSFIYLFIK